MKKRKCATIEPQQTKRATIGERKKRNKRMLEKTTKEVVHKYGKENKKRSGRNQAITKRKTRKLVLMQIFSKIPLTNINI